MDIAWYQYPLLFLVAAVAGAVNAVAGGGTLLTFPALLWAGQLARLANATNTVALWPGQLSSLWGYRREIGLAKGKRKKEKGKRRGEEGETRDGGNFVLSPFSLLLLVVLSLLGGLCGAILLLGTTDATFAALVPYLILAATLLFAAQQPLARWRGGGGRGTGDGGQEKGDGGRGAGDEGEVEGPMANDQGSFDHWPLVLDRSSPPPAPHPPPPVPRAGQAPPLRWSVVLAFQFFVAVYGGYFGAGIGILMLAGLGFLGLTNIHHMNAVKNLNNMCINGVAAIVFIVEGLVDWRLASLMAAGSIVGGYAGAGAAQRIGQDNVRRLVVVIGLGLTVAMFVRKGLGG